MLRFILPEYDTRNLALHISIHLMLRFIGSSRALLHSDFEFQYISCYGLSESTLHRSRRKLYFNTSHVTVYRAYRISSTYPLAISIHLMLRFIQRQFGFRVWGSIFQYISCYGLSAASIASVIMFAWFQYISCYGLSEQNRTRAYQLMNFNTSHVTVYRLWWQHKNKHTNISIHLMLRFILFLIKTQFKRSAISIHLMLRFIMCIP